MSDKNYTDEEVEWAKKLILPDRSNIPDTSHIEAFYRAIINRIYDRVFDAYFDVSEGIVSGDEKIAELLGKLANELPDGAFDDDPDIPTVEKFAKHWGIPSDMKRAITEDHCGDCTAVAMSCYVCYLEQFYPPEHRTPYEGKHEGWRAMHIIRWAQENGKI